MPLLHRKIIVSLFLFATLTMAPTLQSITIFKRDMITVHNTTDKTLYVATYLKRNLPFKAEKVGATEAIEKQSEKKIKRPSRKLGWDRRLLFSTEHTVLEKTLNERAYAAMPKVPIGELDGAIFYLTQEVDRLVGYKARQWLAKKTAEKLAIPKIYEKFKGLFQSIVDLARTKLAPKHEHSGDVATVRKGSAVSSQEKTFIAQRKAKIKTHLQTVLSKKFGKEYQKLSDDEVPTIGLCFTGGGYRAMIASIGYMQGLGDIDALNAAMYMTGLSGSTWALPPWVLSNDPSIHSFARSFLNKISVDKRGKKITELLKKMFTEYTKGEGLALAKLMLIKKINGQRIGLTDIYGAAVANPVLKGYGKNFYEHRLSHLQNNLKGGRFPMPILTSVEEPIGSTKWFEFNPYEVGSHHLSAYIPSWSLGSRFENGKTRTSAQEQMLAYILGICGSAYAVNLIALIPHLIDKIGAPINFIAQSKKSTLALDVMSEINHIKDTIIPKRAQVLGKRKLESGYLANFTYKMPGMLLNKKPILELSDGGHVAFVEKGKKLLHNFASVPLLQPARNVDILFMCDSDQAGTQGQHLRASVIQAKQEPGRLKQFPPISFDVILDYEKQPKALVFKDEQDITKPITIYAACVLDKTYNPTYDPTTADFISTLNFAWSKDEALLHSGLARHMISKKESAEAIWNAIKWWIDQKRKMKAVPASA